MISRYETQEIKKIWTDENRFGGQERQSMAAEHFSFDAEKGDGQRQPHIRIYNTSRTATVYLRKK